MTFAILSLSAHCAEDESSYWINDALTALAAPPLVVHELGHFSASKFLFRNASELLVFEYGESLSFVPYQGKFSYDTQELTFIGEILGLNLSKSIFYSAGHLSSAVMISTVACVGGKYDSKAMKLIYHLWSTHLCADNVKEFWLYISHDEMRTDYANIQVFSGPVLANLHWAAVMIVGLFGIVDFCVNLV